VVVQTGPAGGRERDVGEVFLDLSWDTIMAIASASNRLMDVSGLALS
jgi:hypothetical protein